MSNAAKCRLLFSNSWFASRPRIWSSGGHSTLNVVVYLLLAAAVIILVLRSSRQEAISSADVRGRRGTKEIPTAAQLHVIPADRINGETLPADLFTSGVPPGTDPPELSILFVSKSKPSNYERRMLLRQGWQLGARKKSKCWCALNDSSMCSRRNEVCQHGMMRWTHRFVIGSMGLDASVQAGVEKEIAVNQDFLLYPAVDSYSRLTWKVLWILRYVSSTLSPPRGAMDYLMLLDDDCFVQVWRVADYLSGAPRTGLYAGHVEDEFVAVSRSRRSRWRVSRSSYNEPRYPKYAWGAGLILSADVATITVRTADTWKNPWFGVDDAFMGVLLNASGVSVVDIEGIYTAGWHKALGCRRDYALRSTQPLVVAGEAREMLALTAAAAQRQSLCAVMDGPVRDLAILVTTAAFPWALAVAACVALVVCGSIVRTRFNSVDRQ